MATITFDTLQYVERLRAGGFTEAQAKAMAEAQKQAIDTATESMLATKNDILQVRDEVREVKADVNLLKWMIGFLIAMTAAILWILIKSNV
jgi:hypothetical protein